MTARRLLALCLISLAATPALAASPPPIFPAEVRTAFKKLLDRPEVPLDARTKSGKKDSAGNPIERTTIVSEKRAGKPERVPMVIVRPAKARGRRPAVIVLHGTGGNKEDQLDLLSKLAGKGIIGIAVDARYHGERAPDAEGADAYLAAITAAWKAPAEGEAQEHPLYYDTVWDLWRVVDYLQKRRDVDKNRLGMMGFSMGGIETWLAASVDERIKVSIPMISVQSFRWSLDNNQWQGRAKTIEPAVEAAAKDLGAAKVNAKVFQTFLNKVTPGILDSFDGPSMIRLFAPRPLLIINGEADPNCPIGGARIVFGAAESAYRSKSAMEKLKVLVAPGVGHEVTEEQQTEALDWLVEWLKP